MRDEWNKGVSGLGCLDVVISNPPYVADGDKESVQREVSQFEPHSALFAGADGLSNYPVIIALLGDLLNKGGSVFFEVGQGQVVACLAAHEAKLGSACKAIIGELLSD